MEWEHDKSLPIEEAYVGEEEEMAEFDEILPVPPYLEDDILSVQEILKEVNLGTEEDIHKTFISAALPEKEEEKLIALLKEYKDAFTWDYDEMPGLPVDIAVHKLAVDPTFIR